MNKIFYRIIYSFLIIYLIICFIPSIYIYCQINKTASQLNGIGGEKNLPVEIIYFKYELNISNVKLLWGTATEINNYGWDVQRTEDFSQWIKIGFVLGSMGQSNSPRDYSFLDTTITKNATYYYRLKQYDNDGDYLYTDTVKVIYNLITGLYESLQINNFELKQNYPNPFNPNTVITYVIPEYGFVTLKIYNSLGKETDLLVNEYKAAGIHNYHLSIYNHFLPTGVYFYKIEFQSNEIKQSLIRKMILLK